MTSNLGWQEHTLWLPDHNLAWYELGSGPTVVALSGGPGDDHAYLRPAVEPLASRFRWVLYDQRGTGRSHLDRLDEETLRPERLVEDLEALRVHLGEERVRLVGHSWGANLALLYSATYPGHVDRAALVGLGPLDEELHAIAAANLMKPLTRAERRQLDLLGEEMERAMEDNDQERMAGLHARRLALSARATFHSPEKASAFVEDYLAAGAHRKLNYRVNHIVLTAYRTIPIWKGLQRISAPLLVLYGYQDFEPIIQAYLVRERAPRTRICFLNKCGHEPWLEQPEAFYRELGAFLAAGGDSPMTEVEDRDVYVFLETERLLLRRFTEADLDNLVDLDADPEVMRYINGGTPTPRAAIESDILPAFLRYYERFPGYGFWAAIEKSGGTFLGWFHFRPPEGRPPDEVELGYRLRRSWWGKGYATEGSRALIDKGFAELGVRRVFATTYEENVASQRVMEKAGLRFVRTFRMTPEELLALGTFESDPQDLWPGEDVEYALERTEWERLQRLPPHSTGQ